MKHVGAMIVLGVLGACSRQEPDTSSGSATSDSAGRAPDVVAETSTTPTSTAPAEDAAPTELAVQQAKEDATERAEEQATGARPSGDATSPPTQQPSESPKTMK